MGASEGKRSGKELGWVERGETLVKQDYRKESISKKRG